MRSVPVACILVMMAFFSPMPLWAESMRTINSHYYTINTDVDEPTAREAELRLNCMFEVYRDRTRGFAGSVNRKLPFFLFAHSRDYNQAGGPPGSAGVFTGDRLMSTADLGVLETWHTLQHEGFHQFACFTMGFDIPIWLNEGLAEYFGEAVYTGDGFVTGLIPADRARSIKEGIARHQFRPLVQMLQMSHAQWNAEANVRNYDQAWSMIHFLAHGEEGKFQQPFINFIRAVSHRQDSVAAWNANLGGTIGFEEHWQKYWTSLSTNPTMDLYVKAETSILTSFLARAIAQKQTFASLNDFLQAARSNSLKCAKEDWLPPTLLTQLALPLYSQMRASGINFSLVVDKRSKLPNIFVTSPKIDEMTGRFTLSGRRVFKVSVDVDTLPQAIAKANSLLKSGNPADREKASETVRKALHESSNSPHQDEAVKLLGEIRRGSH